jgi:hypothetical protein
MGQLPKAAREELQNHIAHLEQVAVERGRILSDATEYRKLSFEVLQEQGIIPAGITFTQARDKKHPAHQPLLDRVYDKIIKRPKARKPRGVERYKSYHVRLGTKKTTASIHPVMETMLALYLDTQPGTPAARSAVRKWIQVQLDNNNDPGRAAVSHWLQGVVLECLVSEELKVRYDEWILMG